ncbi:Uncharacterized protein Rs2_46153 [Raphanus sativus]|nr:Uncharacterized protein Rs2_46153 [Raphanus sativus]
MSGPQSAPDLADFPLLEVEKSTGSSMVKEGKKSSWVAVAQTGSVLAKHVLTYGSEEGKIHETQKNIHDTDEGNWSDVSPSKQGRSNHKTNEDTSIISSPSRFAVLSEEKESGSNLQVEAEVHEEGEILENTSHVSSDDQNRLEHQKQEMGDGNIRRTSAPNSKISTKKCKQSSERYG